MKNSEKYKTPEDRAKAFLSQHTIFIRDNYEPDLINFLNWLDEEDNLQKCPHCGGFAKVVEINDFFHVQCVKCGARSKEVHRDIGMAIDLWNKRV